MVPIVTRKPWGLACLVLNIFLPGSGTFVAAGNQENLRYMVYAILQALTFWMLVGWVWSIVTGVMIYMRSEPPVETGTATADVSASR